jgi:hypothetical protein
MSSLGMSIAPWPRYVCVCVCVCVYVCVCIQLRKLYIYTLSLPPPLSHTHIHTHLGLKRLGDAQDKRQVREPPYFQKVSLRILQQFPLDVLGHVPCCLLLRRAAGYLFFMFSRTSIFPPRTSRSRSLLFTTVFSYLFTFVNVFIIYLCTSLFLSPFVISFYCLFIYFNHFITLSFYEGYIICYFFYFLFFLGIRA